MSWSKWVLLINNTKSSFWYEVISHDNPLHLCLYECVFPPSGIWEARSWPSGSLHGTIVTEEKWKQTHTQTHTLTWAWLNSEIPTSLLYHLLHYFFPLTVQFSLLLLTFYISSIPNFMSNQHAYSCVWVLGTGEEIKPAVGQKVVIFVWWFSCFCSVNFLTTHYLRVLLHLSLF